MDLSGVPVGCRPLLAFLCSGLHIACYSVCDCSLYWAGLHWSRSCGNMPALPCMHWGTVVNTGAAGSSRAAIQPMKQMCLLTHHQCMRQLCLLTQALVMCQEAHLLHGLSATSAETSSTSVHHSTIVSTATRVLLANCIVIPHACQCFGMRDICLDTITAYI